MRCATGTCRCPAPHVIEAVRLAETLAALRGRPLAGLTEVTDATRAVLCDGDERPSRFVTDELVVGQALGHGRPGRADRAAGGRPRQRPAGRLRIRREAGVRRHDLDLRQPIDQARSRLFHRLRLLDLDWIRPAESEVANRGTFRETWQSRWRPEYAVALVEAAVWGTTVAAAATAKLVDVGRGGTPGRADRGRRALPARRPARRAGRSCWPPLAERAALDADVVHLMDALPPLARAQRYGDVRGTDTSRPAAGGRHAGGADLRRPAAGRAGLDDEQRPGACAAGSTGCTARSACSSPVRRPAIAAAMDRRGWTTLAALLGPDRPARRLAGRIVRLLLDAERLADAAAAGSHRALSYGAPAGDEGGLGRRLLRRRGAAADPRRRAARPARRLGRRAGRAASSSTCCRWSGARSAPSARRAPD